MLIGSRNQTLYCTADRFRWHSAANYVDISATSVTLPLEAITVVEDHVWIHIIKLE